MIMSRALILIIVATSAFISLLVFLIFSFHSRRRKRAFGVCQAEMQLKIEQDTISLQKLSEEKKWLLQEIQHRVKNNLQIIISLMESQSIFLTDAAAKKAIKNIQQRVTAMSLVHQRLYTETDTSNIVLRGYITDMIEYLKDSFHLDGDIRFETAIEEVKMDAGSAISLGLIINEAITNAIQHAFPSGCGIVRISVSIQNEQLVLEVSDNGIGLSEKYRLAGVNSLGMRLIRGLARELDGKVALESSERGTRLVVVINYLAHNNRADRF
jgi:two-component sensor histidine kinase